MKNEVQPLRIYNFSHPLMKTEWLSLAGDKYNGVLSFPWEIVSDYATADVVVWDGVISPKMSEAVTRLLEDLKNTKVLLLMGESMSSLRDHKIVKLVELDQIRYVELPGWSVLPEDILGAIEQCHQKLKHV